MAKGSVSEFGDGSFYTTSFTMEEACKLVMANETMITYELTKSRVEQLINCGFLKYKNLKCEYICNAKYAESIGALDHSYETAMIEFVQKDVSSEPIQLSEDADVSGSDIYDAILQEECEKHLIEELEQDFLGIEQEYKKYVDDSKKELEAKIKGIEDGTVKSIEVISIFTAVISLFLSNIIGVMNYAEFGIKAILIMNASVVVCVFFLLLFTRLLISNQKNFRFFITSVLVLIVFLGITAILVA